MILADVIPNIDIFLLLTVTEFESKNISVGSYSIIPFNLYVVSKPNFNAVAPPKENPMIYILPYVYD